MCSFRILISLCLVVISLTEITAQKNLPSVPLYLPGSSAWGRLAVELDDGIKLGLGHENNLVAYCQIKSVEELQLTYKKNKVSASKYVQKWDFNSRGELETFHSQYVESKKDYCWTVTYSYNEKGYLINEEAVFCAIIDKVGAVVFTPDSDKRLYDGGKLIKKTIYYGNDSYERLVYSYNSSGLISSVKTYAGKKLIRETIYEYTYF